VIVGDANLAEVSTYLKVGTTALVLAMIEDRASSSELAADRPSPRCTRFSTTRRCAPLRLREGRL
jgi:proteasome accessory factor A